MARGASGRQTASIMRERAAEMARKGDQAEAKLREARNILGKLPEMTQRGFIYAIETDQVGALPAEMQRFARLMRDLLDGRRNEVQALGTGKLQSYYENYFPHIWKDPKQANQVFMNYFAKRPFEGSKSFLKQRKIPTIEHGIALGLEPVSYNPVDLVLLKLREMDKYVMAHLVLDEMKNVGLLARIKATHRVPDGWEKLDDKVGTIYGRPLEKGTLTIRGHWIAPAPAANVVNNYLSPGLRKYAAFRGYLQIANVLNQFQLGVSFFHFGFTSLDAAISKGAFALQELAYGKPLDAMKSMARIPIAPITNILQGRKVYKAWEDPGAMGPEWDAIADAAQAGGGRIKMDQFYASEMSKKMVEAFRRQNLTGVAEGMFRLPFAAIEQVSRPLMEYLVPRQKLGVFADLARLELERLGPGASREDVRKTMAKVWDSVDNRMGQLVYDNLFWDKWFKDMLMASIRSVGWNLGTKREVLGGSADFAKFATNLVVAAAGKGRGGGGGGRGVSYKYGGDWFSGRPEFTYRMGYIIMLVMVTGAVGALINYLMTGEAPREMKDYFFPRTGEKDDGGRDLRVSMPTYIKDIYHYYEEPYRTALNKAHPALNIMGEILSNRDFYGTEIWNHDDPPTDKAKEILTYLAGQFEPFSVRGLREEQKRQSGVPPWFPFVGLTPAPKALYKTEAERMMDEMMAERRPVGTRTKEEARRAETRREITRDLKRGIDAQPKIAAAMESGELSPAQMPSLMRRARTPGIVWGFQGLDLDQALKVWSVATPEERATLRPHLRKKMQTLGTMPEAERERLLPLAREVLGQ